MARLKKPEKVDTVYFHDTGVVIDVMQNRNDWTFFAEYQGEIVSSPQKALMPQLVRDLYKRLTVELDWKRAISVSIQPPDHQHEVSLSFKCFDWAYRPTDNRLMQRSVRLPHLWQGQMQAEAYGTATIWQGWTYNLDLPEKRNKPSGVNERELTFRVPVYGRALAYLPFTQELWDSLTAIDQMIGKLSTELTRIVTTPEGNEMLLQAGAFSAFLLPPADQDERDEAQTIKNWEAVDWQRDLESEDSDDE